MHLHVCLIPSAQQESGVSDVARGRVPFIRNREEWDGSMKIGRQTTLCEQIALTGVGVHSGLPVTLTLHPADAGTGIRFVRTGLPGQCDREVRAEFNAVTATEFATVLGDEKG